jgi:glyoxylase-like metal-dependent hydrolase (beta-lactamase superfamily II)
MLEDDFTWVLKKALTGNGLAPSEAAARAGITEGEVMAFLRGSFSAETARALAPVLGLSPEAFAAHSAYQPVAPDVPQIHRLDLPFGGERVNAWLVSQAGMVVLFDAGFETGDLLGAVQAAAGRLPDRVFITHAHRDHIGALETLVQAGVPVHAAGIPATIPMAPGDAVVCGELTIRACDLSGHATPALGFHLDGLGRPVLVSGDAMFAGSIGGCSSPDIYRHALGRLRAVLSGLPDGTIVLPGHGPATTLGSERMNNPFL